MNGFTALLRDERGAAMTEYALILAFLGITAIAALTTLSGAITNALTNLSTKLASLQSG